MICRAYPATCIIFLPAGSIHFHTVSGATQLACYEEENRSARVIESLGSFDVRPVIGQSTKLESLRVEIYMTNEGSRGVKALFRQRTDEHNFFASSRNENARQTSSMPGESPNCHLRRVPIGSVLHDCSFRWVLLALTMIRMICPESLLARIRKHVVEVCAAKHLVKLECSGFVSEGLRTVSWSFSARESTLK